MAFSNLFDMVKELGHYIESKKLDHGFERFLIHAGEYDDGDSFILIEFPAESEKRKH